MPTYEYECAACRRVFEIRQRISEPPLTTCDACGGAVHRLLSAAPFILKGEGWYVTDYPSESRKKAREAEKSSSTAADTSAKTETKSETKAETKSESKSDSKSSGAKSDGGSSTSGASSGATTSSKPD
ncbi:MAG TPA: FmdB family zinc ribbon protein [Patescibacteria group bacterium]|nr:FmdB family zinc ribbon protein [Patescibacteria group bacterium]